VKDIPSDTCLGAGKSESLNDVADSLAMMDRKWSEVFRQNVGKPSTSSASRRRLRFTRKSSAGCSTLVKFQRTCGVLRSMAAVIHSLWEKGDRKPLILPAKVSIDDGRMQSELSRYLSDNWVPVSEKEVDGPNSLPPPPQRRRQPRGPAVRPPGALLRCRVAVLRSGQHRQR